VHAGDGLVGREARCPWCKRVFFVCECCDQGQVYCGPEHRDAGRRASRRRSNAVHQASEEGREDHRDHNEAYRKRRREAREAALAIAPEEQPAADPAPSLSSVTGHPAEKLPSAATLAPAESAPAVTRTTAPLLAGER
jgi:hypothetical protein